ncbi:MAG TPA: Xaa-Pro peptidase family protein [Gaiellaceae bacterium]|nr:Xaa-Pro peptidase family protein [Gaiellaceae bacterium]
MPDVLIHGASMGSPEMRHEVPVSIPDPFLFAEHDGRRVAILTAFEITRVKEADSGIETLSPENFGWDDLIASGKSRVEAGLEVYLRACREIGITEAAVPARFPVELADHLRANGVTVRVDRELFENRRRSKNATEIAGLRRAQKACEAALDRSREMLRNATVNGSGLMLDGEPLTCEWIKREIEAVFSEHGAFADEFIVSHGVQTSIGHDMGSGQIQKDEPISFDLFPRDRETGVYSDMTRTYVVGTPSDELLEYHRLCKEALDRTTEAAGPGVNGRALMQIACDIFDAHGYPTQLSKKPGEVLNSGFFHSLGHGVGLEVHERPWMSVTGDDLIPGDVITLEPGLYREGYGGLRLEDILIVTEDGVEVVTQYPYDITP